MSEVNTYRRAARLLERRLVLGQARADAFSADADDVLDLASALGWDAEAAAAGEGDAVRVTFRCGRSGYVAVLEKDGCAETPAASTRCAPVGAGVSLLVEQVLGKCLEIAGSVRPLRRRQSAESLGDRRPAQAVRRAESLSALSREATFRVPPAAATAGVRVHPRVAAALDDVVKAFATFVDRLSQETLGAVPRRTDTPRPQNKAKY